MTHRIQAWIERHALLRAGDLALAAVSGGADSVAMLISLHELAGRLGFAVEVIHLDHAIRKESAADAAFVRDLAQRLGLPVTIRRTLVPRLARERGISTEMAAREARLSFFADSARRRGAACVATAHTADDQAETVLLRLLRGCGPRGLSGIAPESRFGDLRLVHPLLCVRHAEVVRYLTGLHVAWREDPSNRCTDFLRNRVRHEVLPLLEGRINPAARDALVRTAALLREDADWLDALGEQTLDVLVAAPGGPDLTVAALNAMPPALRRRVVRLWLARAGLPLDSLPFGVIEDVLELAATARGTRSIDMQGGVRVVRRYGVLSAAAGGRETSGPPPASQRLRVPGESLLIEQNLRVLIERKPGLERQPHAALGVFPAWATLSANALRGRRLWVRSWRAGDRMAPLGMKGSRKLQDIFTDAKVPAPARAGLPVITDGSRIVWLPGYRVARGFEVIDPGRKGLHIRVERLA